MEVLTESVHPQAKSFCRLVVSCFHYTTKAQEGFFLIFENVDIVLLQLS